MSRGFDADQAAEETDADSRPSRSAERRERKESEAAMAKLATELSGLSERRLGVLGLPEMVESAVRDARRIVSPAAHNRALRRVRQQLRECDWAAIAALVHGVGTPTRAAATHDSALVESWYQRLIDEGDSAVDALVQRYPTAERQTLRMLNRNLKLATPKTESRARAALLRWLGEQLKTADQAPNGEGEYQPPED